MSFYKSMYNKMKKIIKIIGIGMDYAQHITMQAINEIKSSDKILLLGIIPTEIAHLAIENSCIEDITDLYKNNAVDQNNYENIKQKILTESTRNTTVCLVIPGHPRVAVTLTQMLQKDANALAIECIVTPGISSFDTMLNDLMLDPLERGTCLLDANRLLLLDFNLDPKLNYFIYHICSIGNAKTNYLTPTADNQFKLLQDKLMQHFPPDHMVSMITSATGQRGTVVQNAMLSELPELLSKVHFDCTLYVPGISINMQDVNKNFLQMLLATAT